MKTLSASTTALATCMVVYSLVQDLNAEQAPAAPIPPSQQAQTDAASAGAKRVAAIKRWHQAKFGLFLHWGAYSVYGGTYNGKELWSAEWIQENARIPYAKYAKTAASWNPTEFDAEAWVQLAKNAGMGYIVITSRHHDGFAIYPSKASRYNLMANGAYKGPDPLAALKAACAKHGLLFGIYYSPLEFRSSPKGFDAEDEKAVAEGFDYRTLGPQPYATNADVVALAQAQIKELAEWYKPDIFWFDGTWDKMGLWTEEDARQAEKSLRSVVPDILINNRSGAAAADFNTFENEIPEQAPASDWEYCWNMGVFWGYNPRNYTPELIKTPDHYIETLVHIASLGGNYLLNVGPDASGTFHPMAVEYLTKIGAWTNANGAAVRGVSKSPFKNKPSWGYVTSREGKIYLIIKELPAGETRLSIPALKNQASGARLLDDPKQAVDLVTESDHWVVGPITANTTTPFRVIEISVMGIPEAAE